MVFLAMLFSPSDSIRFFEKTAGESLRKNGASAVFVGDR